MPSTLAVAAIMPPEPTATPFAASTGGAAAGAGAATGGPGGAGP